MENPHASPLVSLYLAELVFGLLYAWLIHWLAVNHYLEGSTAWSVVIGNAATLFIEWIFIPTGWNHLVTFGSFAFSGLPMVLTYLYRHQKRMESHKRRPWPTQAAKVRDEAIMALTGMADEISRKTKAGEIAVQDMADVVNRLHLLRSLLKSV